MCVSSYWRCQSRKLIKKVCFSLLHASETSPALHALCLINSGKWIFWIIELRMTSSGWWSGPAVFLSTHDWDIITSQTVEFLSVFACPVMLLRSFAVDLSYLWSCVLNAYSTMRARYVCWRRAVHLRSGLFGSGFSCTINQDETVIIKSQSLWFN